MFVQPVSLLQRGGFFILFPTKSGSDLRRHPPESSGWLIKTMLRGQPSFWQDAAACNEAPPFRRNKQ
ncbi:hypothetical protein ACH50_04070 [Franconibacter pulveris]|uniref:Uncharacterized protein n=1 Tax=Franconibacter pulveris TaxID=435910 RepID=A0A0J8VSQ2_9ENTR|nr:hypothetical protein ACH50_04070 [Franconibacter pulveris]